MTCPAAATERSRHMAEFILGFILLLLVVPASVVQGWFSLFQ